MSAITSFNHSTMRWRVTYSINSPFGELFHTQGQVAHVLRTRSPLSTRPKSCLSFDLHVLTMPPAFTLSQDQTLQESYATKRIGSSQINDSFIFSKKLIGNPFIGSHKITFKEQPSYLRERVPTNRESNLSSSEMIFFISCKS